MDAFKHAGENIVFASGSPFEHVDLGIIFFFPFMVLIRRKAIACRPYAYTIIFTNDTVLHNLKRISLK